MLYPVVVPAMRLRHLRITAIERLGGVIAVVAVVMVRHVRRHVCLVMVDNHRFRLRVIRRVVAVVVRRRPNGVRRMSIHVPHRRTLHEDRTNDIVITVQVRIAYHLYVQQIGSALCHYCSDVLEHARAHTSLQQQGVVVPAGSLNNADVINPSVAIKIEVINHVPARVEDLLKLSDGV